jgi:hypothetical protein
MSDVVKGGLRPCESPFTHEQRVRLTHASNGLSIFWWSRLLRRGGFQTRPVRLLGLRILLSSPLASMEL